MLFLDLEVLETDDEACIRQELKRLKEQGVLEDAPPRQIKAVLNGSNLVQKKIVMRMIFTQLINSRRLSAIEEHGSILGPLDLEELTHDMEMPSSASKLQQVIKMLQRLDDMIPEMEKNVELEGKRAEVAKQLGDLLTALTDSEKEQQLLLTTHPLLATKADRKVLSMLLQRVGNRLAILHMTRDDINSKIQRCMETHPEIAETLTGSAAEAFALGVDETTPPDVIAEISDVISFIERKAARNKRLSELEEARALILGQFPLGIIGLSGWPQVLFDPSKTIEEIMESTSESRRISLTHSLDALEKNLSDPTYIEMLRTSHGEIIQALEELETVRQELLEKYGECVPALGRDGYFQTLRADVMGMSIREVFQQRIKEGENPKLLFKNIKSTLERSWEFFDNNQNWLVEKAKTSQMANQAGRKSGPSKERLAKRAAKSQADRELRNQMKGAKGGKPSR